MTVVTKVGNMRAPFRRLKNYWRKIIYLFSTIYIIIHYRIAKNTFEKNISKTLIKICGTALHHRDMVPNQHAKHIQKIAAVALLHLHIRRKMKKHSNKQSKYDENCDNKTPQYTTIHPTIGC